MNGPAQRGFRGLVGALLILGGLIFGEVEFASAQTRSRPEIARLNFEGNASFPDRVLANAILTREVACRSSILLPFCWAGAEFAIDPSFLNDRVFAQDYVRIQLFYRQRGYREVQVDTVVERITPTRVEITFQIQEGEPVRVSRLDLQGADRVSGPLLGRDLPLRVGDPLNMVVLEAVRDTLTQRLRDRGYAHAEVLRSLFIPRDAPRTAEVEFDVYTGPIARFGEIRIEGNEGVGDGIVERMLPFREGSVYSQEALFEAQRNLYGLEIFRHASVVPDLTHTPDSIVPLLLQVNEGNARRVRSGGGWNNADCFSLESRWASRNFFGGARRLGLTGRVSNLLTRDLQDSVCSDAGQGDFARLNWLASVDFTQPWIFSPRNTLNVRAFAERQSVPDVYIRESVGFNFSLRRVLGRASPLTLSYLPQWGRLSAAEVFFCTNFLVCTASEIDLLEGSNRLSPMVLAFAHDRTDRQVSPRRGYTLAAEIEAASRWTASDFDYQRAAVETTFFRPLFSDWVVGGRLRGGWLNAAPFRGFASTGGASVPVAHPQKRFYAGGANSVRGYAQSQLGPRVVTVGVEELLFPVGGGSGALCDPESISDLTCNAGALAEGSFESRPTGGSAVLEGNLELRFPIWDPSLGGALFLDAGQVWSDPARVRSTEVVATPGIGLRYATPIGPVRVDVAYRPPIRQDLPVVTSSIRRFDPETDDPALRLAPPGGDPIDWVPMDSLARLTRPVGFTEASGFSFRRLQFHFAIGHAF
jgi:outer membrane protein assembly factor BamA